MDEAIEPIVSMLSPAKDKGNGPQEGAHRDDWGGWIFAFARKEVTAKAAEHVETGYMNIGEVGRVFQCIVKKRVEALVQAPLKLPSSLVPS